LLFFFNGWQRFAFLKILSPWFPDWNLESEDAQQDKEQQ
jgi:hypothetical protein